MIAKQYQTSIPADLRDAVRSSAQAVVDGDMARAEGCVEGPVLDAYRAALESAAQMRPLRSFELLAHARLGLQFIVKVRFQGANGRPLPLQLRWRRQNGNRWRIVEVENLNEISPWRRPDKPRAVTVDA